MLNTIGRNAIWPRLKRKCSFCMKAPVYQKILRISPCKKSIFWGICVCSEDIYIGKSRERIFIEIPKIRFLATTDQTTSRTILDTMTRHIIWYFHCLFNHMIPCIEWVTIIDYWYINIDWIKQWRKFKHQFLRWADRSLPSVHLANPRNPSPLHLTLTRFLIWVQILEISNFCTEFWIVSKMSFLGFDATHFDLVELLWYLDRW